MPEVRHIAHVATTTIVTAEQLAALVKSGEYVEVKKPKVPKSTSAQTAAAAAAKYEAVADSLPKE